MNKVTANVETSHAILRLSGKYVIQLRDDKPDIACRGQWSLFGGRIDPGETPLEAIKREVFEELSIKQEDFKFLWHADYYSDFVKCLVRTWFFTAELDNVWSGHNLKEGREIGIFSFEELKTLDIPEVIRKSLNRFNKEAGKP
ncbi:MAG: NUDIX domain-containing protein [Candidatus Omnitrophica bacterium]|nr:NUDIX domain-containing protein [Candidatus Omnitrophota bacterium]